MASTADAPLKDTLNLHWKNDKSAFGFRMLKKMGWSEDKGLGKNEDGAKSAVKLDKRDTSLGLGMEADSAGNLAWNSTSSSFTDILKMLNTTYSEEAKKKDKAAKKKGSSKSARVTVGVKYKKLTAAKDLSTKSANDLKSIFGFDPHSNSASSSQPAVSSGSIAGTMSADASSADKKSKKKTKKSSEKEIISSDDSESESKKPKKSKKSKRRSDDNDSDSERTTEEKKLKKSKKKRSSSSDDDA